MSGKIPPRGPRALVDSSLKGVPTAPRSLTAQIPTVRPAISIQIRPPPPSVPPPPQPAPPPPDNNNFKPFALPGPSALPPPAAVFERPSWPPPRSATKSFKVIYDPALEKRPDSYYSSLIELIRTRCPASLAQDRIKGKGKGKESLYRYDGQVFENGQWATLSTDHSQPPDTQDFFTHVDGVQWLRERIPHPHDPRKRTDQRHHRTEFYPLTYEYDEYSAGPSPPNTVLITNISPLAPTLQIRRHFSAYGHMLSFEPQIDKENGSALGIVFIRFQTHDQAKRCAERENGKKPSLGPVNEEIRVVLDGEGLILKAVLKELDDRKKREKKRKDVPPPPTPSTPSTATPSTLPRLPQGLPARPQFHPLPPNPKISASPPSTELAAVPMQGRLPRRPLPTSRYDTWKAVPMRSEPRRYPSASSTPRARSDYRRSDRHWSPMSDYSRSRSPSRSPSRVRRKPEMEYADLSKVLTSNGKDHIKVDSDRHFLAMVSEDDVRRFFDGFKVDQVLRSSVGLFVTFETDDSARRAALVLANRQLAYHDVTLSVHSLPPSTSTPSRKSWTESELVDEAQAIILKELKALLERDVKERIVASDLRKIAALSRVRGVVPQENGVAEHKPAERKGLKGLSFKKKTPKVEVKVESPPEEEEDEEVIPDRPTKKPKRADKVKKLMLDEAESEDDVKPSKHALESREHEEEPLRKKTKIEKKPLKRKKSAKVDCQVLNDTSSLSSSRSPSPTVSSTLPTPSQPATPSPVTFGICDDDEDAYFAKLVLSGHEPNITDQREDVGTTSAASARKHFTGSARTEGFYKITYAEKAAYVTQYQSRATNIAVRDPVDDTQPQHVTSSRSNRANARRRAQGLEEINQVQRAVALSKGENAVNELTFKFNQLQTRKKHLRFARSPIHDWGLYAMERIARGEMVIEYVGEIIRAQVADKREKNYERQGIGSSYLFRIDEDLVVDATKKGNLGRLINHSCDPNCTAKIITINGEKKIVIYAKQDIELGDEITYDYHFPIEQDKIPCLCGSVKCRGYLN